MGLLTGKGFLVASFAVAFVVAGGAVALMMTDAPVLGGRLGGGWDKDGCDADAPDGRALDVAAQDTGVTGRARPQRIVTYTLDADGALGGSIALCTSVGDVDVVPSRGSGVRLVFTITAEEGDRERLVREARVEARFARDGDALRVVGAHVNPPRDSPNPTVDVRLEIPASGPYAVALNSGVGDVDLAGLLVSSLALNTGVGDVDAAGVDLAGDAALNSGVGDVRLQANSVQSGEIALNSGVGDVEASLPQRVDVGYDATAKTGVGEVRIEIGPTESASDSSREPYAVGGSAHARSRGYDSKPTKVEVVVNTGTGDATVLAEA